MSSKYTPDKFNISISAWWLQPNLFSKWSSLLTLIYASSSSPDTPLMYISYALLQLNTSKGQYLSASSCRDVLEYAFFHGSRNEWWHKIASLGNKTNMWLAFVVGHLVSAPQIYVQRQTHSNCAATCDWKAAWLRAVGQAEKRLQIIYALL